MNIYEFRHYNNLEIFSYILVSQSMQLDRRSIICYILLRQNQLKTSKLKTALRCPPCLTMCFTKIPVDGWTQNWPKSKKVWWFFMPTYVSHSWKEAVTVFRQLWILLVSKIEVTVAVRCFMRGWWLEKHMKDQNSRQTLQKLRIFV